MKKLILLACLLIVGKLFAFDPKVPIDLRWTGSSFDPGQITVGENELLYDTLIVGESVRNLTYMGSEALGTLPGNFSISITPGEIINPGRKPYSIGFTQLHAINAPYIVALKFSSNGQLFSLLKEIKYSASYGDKYSAIPQDAYDAGLIAELKKFVENHTSLSYKDARTLMFSQIDNVEGEVECVYTGRKIEANGIPDVQTTHFNTEHTWPQSLGAEDEPEKSDLYHIRPSDEQANSARANFPFGYVTSNITYAEGGSRLGKNSEGKTVFEARDERKGDIARGMFYFALRYGNKSNYLTEQESDLREYAKADPPDEIEKKRNESISAAQGKSNPFIDHPELLSRIYSLSGASAPNSPVLSLSDTLIKTSKPPVGSSEVSFVVYNSSGVAANLLSWSVESLDATASPKFEPTFSTIPPRSYAVFDIQPPDNVSGSGVSTIALEFDGMVAPMKLKYEWMGDLAVADLRNALSVYPNPFTDIVVIQAPECLGFEIYDLFGSSVYSEETANASGKYEISRNKFGSQGVYVVKIRTSYGVTTRKIILN